MPISLKRLIYAGLPGILLAAMGAWWSARSPVSAQAAGEKTCRFNMTVARGLSGYEDKFPALRVGSYLDWKYSASPATPNGAEYIQVLRVSDARYAEALDAVATVVPAVPGSAWVIGNEPDRVAIQDSLTPEVYAERFYALATGIRSQDPSARIGFGAIVQPTPIRLRYLDRAWSRLVELSGNPYAASDLIDFWALHAFILCEDCGWGADIPPGMTPLPGELLHIDQECSTWPSAACFPETHDNAIFNQFVRDFRAWMHHKGETDKPLWITEYGSLLPWWWVPESETARFMTETFDFLLAATDGVTGLPGDGGRLVQRWYWFSLNVGVDGYGGSLYDPDQGGQITQVGTAWLGYDYIQNPTSYPADPYPLAVRPTFAGGDQYAFRVRVANDGDAALVGGYGVSLFQGNPDVGGTQLGTTQLASSDLEGCGAEAVFTFFVDVAAPAPWDLYLRITPNLPSNDSDLGNNTRAFLQTWPRSFADVAADHWALRWIEAIYQAGLTAGCHTTPLLYCPEAPVTRAQMAVFLMRGIHGSGYAPPAPSGPPPFSDVAGHWAEAWIRDLHVEGLTVGYPDGSFRPENSVSRAEMAVFLLRAKYGNTYFPPPPGGGSFSDVSGHWAEAWIEALKGEGITSGYPDGSYRPDNGVLRSEMAVFLTKAFSLPLP